jgi:hypothetical protein
MRGLPLCKQLPPDVRERSPGRSALGGRNQKSTLLGAFFYARITQNLTLILYNCYFKNI